MCLCDIAASFTDRKNTYYKWAEPTSAFAFCLHLPCLLPCLSVHRRLSNPRSALLSECPAPTAVRAPITIAITAVLPRNKRESVRHHPLDLFHARAPTSAPDGVAFFQGFSQPQESSKMTPPPEPTTQLPVIHLLCRHAPMARAHPLSLYPPGSPIKIIKHFFSTKVHSQDIILVPVKTFRTFRH